MKKIYFFSLILLISGGCKTPEKAVTKAKTFEVSFGNFGGFTNSSTEYIIYENGGVTKIENNTKMPLHKIQKNDIKKIRQQIESINFKNININELGNLTYFIKVKTTDYENTVKWNDETQNTELKNTYRMLFEILRQ